MNVKEAIKELRDSYELKHCDWAYRCLETIEEELEKKDKEINFYKNGIAREIEERKEKVLELEKKDKIIDEMAKRYKRRFYKGM